MVSSSKTGQDEPAHGGISGDPNRFARDLFARLPARYDLLAEILSLGQNRRWRRELVDHLASCGPQRTLDVAAGPAGVTIELAERAGGQVVGVDLTFQMLRQGARNVAGRHMERRIQLVVGKAEQLPFPDGSFDALSFTYLLRYVADPQQTLKEIARVVKPGGVVASLEFFYPQSPVWRTLWRLYTAIVLPLAGLVGGGRAWFNVGRFLGPSISDHYRRFSLDWTVLAWHSAGFEQVETKVMSLGGGLVMWGRRASG